MVCDTLEELRRKVVAEAGTLKEAIGVARLAEFDPAILDLRLGDETTELVAEITRGRGLPIFSPDRPHIRWIARRLPQCSPIGKPVPCSALGKMIENCGRS